MKRSEPMPSKTIWFRPNSGDSTALMASGFRVTSEALAGSATPAPAMAAVRGETCSARNFIVTPPGSTFQCSPAKAREPAARAAVRSFLNIRLQDTKIDVT